MDGALDCENVCGLLPIPPPVEDIECDQEYDLTTGELIPCAQETTEGEEGEQTDEEAGDD